MTLDEILALQPGPVMDAKVAKDVMGWTYGHPCPEDMGCIHWADRDGMIKDHRPPAYSTEAALAWEVEKEMVRRNLRVAYTQALQLVIRSRKEYATMFDYVHASPADRCKAALLVVTLGAERFEGMARAG